MYISYTPASAADAEDVTVGDATEDAKALGPVQLYVPPPESVGKTNELPLHTETLLDPNVRVGDVLTAMVVVIVFVLTQLAVLSPTIEYVVVPVGLTLKLVPVAPVFNNV